MATAKPKAYLKKDRGILYSSKKPMKQQEFPPRPKRVRAKPSLAPNVIEQPQVTEGGMRRKRKSATRAPDEDNEQEPILWAEKRRTRRIGFAKTDAAESSQYKGSAGDAAKVEATEEAEHLDAFNYAGSGTGLEMSSRRHWARQQTLTQLADGRRPTLDETEPEIQAPSRSKRTKRKGTKKGTGDSQRTLTQMIPRATTLPDSEIENEDNDAGADKGETEYNTNIQQHLVNSGILELAELYGNEDEEPPAETSIQHLSKTPPSKKYTRRQHLAGRGSVTDAREDGHWAYLSGEGHVQTKFNIPSTPQRGRMREIPSSQSPPDSSLSTQLSTRKRMRFPLQERTTSQANLQETPSKRRRVTFSTVLDTKSHCSTHVSPATFQIPSRHYVFREVIQDSEEENDVGFEDESVASEPPSVGPETQMMMREIDRSWIQKSLDDSQDARRAPSEELGDPTYKARNPSFELVSSITGKAGDSCKVSPTSAYDMDAAYVPTASTNSINRLKCVQNGNMRAYETFDQTLAHLVQNSERLPIAPVTSDRNISNTIFDEEHARSHDTDTLDLDEPSHGSYLALTLGSDHIDAESQGSTISGSKEAEAQLRSESEFYKRRQWSPPTSSMRVAYDDYSYRQMLRSQTDLAVIPSSPQTSQATTIDCTQSLPVEKTLQKPTANTQFITSPSTLRQPQVIPSSVSSSLPGSPLKRAESCESRDTSSPILMKSGIVTASQMVSNSMVDFSIPPLPPWEEDEG